jgi:hypothetical protein
MDIDVVLEPAAGGGRPGAGQVIVTASAQEMLGGIRGAGKTGPLASKGISLNRLSSALGVPVTMGGR